MVCLLINSFLDFYWTHFKITEIPGRNQLPFSLNLQHYLSIGTVLQRISRSKKQLINTPWPKVTLSKDEDKTKIKFKKKMGCHI